MCASNGTLRNVLNFMTFSVILAFLLQKHQLHISLGNLQNYNDIAELVQASGVTGELRLQYGLKFQFHKKCHNLLICFKKCLMKPLGVF